MRGLVVLRKGILCNQTFEADTCKATSLYFSPFVRGTQTKWSTKRDHHGFNSSDYWLKRANAIQVQHTTSRQTFCCINGPVPWKPLNGYVAKANFGSKFLSMEV